VASDAATVTVAAPLVGVVYRSREPSAAPFVACGQQVAEGEVLCLIEAMKLFNEVLAPCAGTIGAILFEDGMLAEYGAPLFSILPAPPASPNPPAPPTSDSAPPTPPPAPPASGSASAAPSPVG
jgi:pyruvate/2-oxoglutarate dehydrogenase complex dihydrolipoamide acyltransferase (E2) component